MSDFFFWSKNYQYKPIDDKLVKAKQKKKLLETISCQPVYQGVKSLTATCLGYLYLLFKIENIIRAEETSRFDN